MTCTALTTKDMARIKAQALRDVTRGVKLLDQEVMEWRNHIDLDDLDLDDCDICVLGQLFGDYDSGLERLGLIDTGSEDVGYDVKTSAAAHGFNTNGAPDRKSVV